MLLRQMISCSAVITFSSEVQANTDGLELRDLQAAFAQLPAEQREVMLLIVLEEMAYQEVAKALDLPLGTVMSRLSRGRARLRILMEGGAAPVALTVVK